MSDKPHYRAVILVIATNDTQYFKNCRKIWKAYKDLNKNIKVFFVYGKLCESLEDKDSSDIIFEEIVDDLILPTVPKNLLAMNHIYNTCTYDYLIRTNLSTFWDFKNIELLLEQCPKEKCYTGGHDLSPFLIQGVSPIMLTKPLYSGVCMVFTPDVVLNMLQNVKKFNFILPDDISIGLYLSDCELNTVTIRQKTYFEGYNLLENNIVYDITKAIENRSIYYRVKNVVNRELTDLIIYKNLLALIYRV
jgi:hypothetical protein